MVLFAAAELSLAMAIPFLLIHGYHTLLSSNSGTFVDAPTIDEPGWSALVSATPLTAVVDVVDGAVTGAALIVAPGHDSPSTDATGVTAAGGSKGDGGGTVVLIPGDLSIAPELMAAVGRSPEDPSLLSALDPAVAGQVIARLLNLDIATVAIMDDRAWTEALSGSSYELDNPDPVPATGASDESDDLELAFAVGAATVDGSNAAVFVGRPVRGGSLSSITPRRRQLWAAMLGDPPTGDHAITTAIRSAAGASGTGQVVDLPTIDESGTVVIDGPSTEVLLRDIVPFPSGSRLEVRVVDRTGRADLIAIAAQLAGRGIEVVEIANAIRFDDGSTQVIQSADLPADGEQLKELTDALGVEPLVDEEQTNRTVTVLVGEDFSLPD